jgi:CheY-like chemotaxis protein
MNILVLDDEPGVLWAFEQMLSGAKATLHTARNGVEGLEILRHQSLDLVICDIRMPGMDGIEFARRLRCEPSTAEVPLVLMSGAGLEDHEKIMIECNAMGFLTKPPEISLVRALVFKARALSARERVRN